MNRPKATDGGKVAVVRYNAGNTASVRYALERLGAGSLVTDDPEELRAADRVIFPGVGEASTAMRFLRERGLDRVIRSLTRPVLGICLGMQLLCGRSEENDTDCLGLLPERVRRFDPAADKVPHMGWNRISVPDEDLFRGVPDGSYVYFVHGYYVESGEATTAVCRYGGVTFSAALRRGNFRAVQFHPERSGAIGETILRNFLAL